MEKRNLWGMLLLFLSVCSFVSCSDDDKTIVEPEGTITLNMLNEDNGKVMLGQSGVYLNKSNNLTGRGVWISDLGRMPNLGHVSDIKVLATATEIAATVSHGYLIYSQDMIMEFPSGNKAFRVKDTYYKMYIESAMEDNTGIKVKYLPVTLSNDVLPEPGTDIGSFVYNYRLQIDITRLKDIEYIIPDNEEYFDCSIYEEEEQGKVVKYLTVNQIKNYSYHRTLYLYLRTGNTFTYLTFTAQ
ncbi:DUF5036 family protein [Sanguibacteroides justesenii]|uniref:DUF5036 family protein n=1 Tax=Sanguibacteroides justesenii TaxID=1547597 RepID=UPI0006988547|nr:DUF5036 family protein [Sanguibacteroides justesenii]